MTADSGPTDGQRCVIELSTDARAFVIAGPGAGKTWALLQRAVRLTSEDGLEAAELLVLSFTRAVVSELRKRDRDLLDPSRIRPETFDAFATRLLAEHAADDKWQTAGFDGRIEAATRLLEAGVVAESLTRVRHVLLDEVQDLVGVRSRFVAALLRANAGGFTAFGDPAQAIYDHERGRHDDGFLDNLRTDLADEVHQLNGNHRASGELASVAEELRGILLDGQEDAAVCATLDAFSRLPTLGNFTDLALALDGVSIQAAILCRDNATALQLSQHFHDAGLPHRVRRGSADRPVAGWVAAVFDGRASLSQSTAAERHAVLSDLDFPGLPSKDRAWTLLSRLDPRARGGAVRASEIGSKIAIGRVPWELLDEPNHRLQISSIHRAKGLEFDACVVVAWPPREEEDAVLEARVLFVALTRARQDCYHADGPSRGRWFRCAEAYDRFVKRGREDWQTLGMEIRGEDVHAEEPAGEIAIAEQPREIQTALIEGARPGDDVVLQYLEEYDFGWGKRPMYAVVHGREGPIGVTGSRFGDAMRSRLWNRRRPQRISGVRVHDLETVKRSGEVADAAGLGRSGLWLRPRLIGLGEFDWSG